MDGQGLQAVRSEIEAIVTFQAALNRLALHVDENALTEWTGPRPDDVDALAGDDGTFSRDELNEVRKQAAAALSTRFREVLQSVASQPALMELLRKAVLTGTGGVVHLDGPHAEAVLKALTTTGAIRQDWAQEAANSVREALASLATPVKAPAQPRRKPAAKPKKTPGTKKKKPAARAAPKAKKAPKKKGKPAPKARKPAPKRRASGRSKKRQ